MAFRSETTLQHRSEKTNACATTVAKLTRRKVAEGGFLRSRVRPALLKAQDCMDQVATITITNNKDAYRRRSRPHTKSTTRSIHFNDETRSVNERRQRNLQEPQAKLLAGDAHTARPAAASYREKTEFVSTQSLLQIIPTASIKINLSFYNKWSTKAPVARRRSALRPQLPLPLPTWPHQSIRTLCSSPLRPPARPSKGLPSPGPLPSDRWGSAGRCSPVVKPTTHVHSRLSYS
jgi:hypothetical protein